MDKCIQSLLKAGEEVEILIINDGSTKDNTKEIAEKYQREYPTICKAINKENGGHGDAVNYGLANATGKYFKVVDSDDWVDESALKKVLNSLRKFENIEESPEAVVVNYVYEHTYSGKQRVVEFSKKMPIEKKFSFEEVKKFGVGQFMAMHSVIYLTQLLRDIKLQLPKHTFYVDNIFVYTPLSYVKKFYYINVDFYRYFIGRPDQSVQENIQMQRIDQHIRVNKIMIDAHDITALKKQRPKLYKYMRDYLMIITVISSIFLIKIGDREALNKKKELWDYFMDKFPKECKRTKKKLVGITASNNLIKLWFSKVIYKIAKKKLKFN